MDRSDRLHSELDSLEEHLPKWARNLLRRVRRPDAVWLRLPLAIALIVGGVLGFLPLLGFWMLPLGLALLAFELPFLRAPLARFLGFINRKLSPQAE
jgi:hypothetical protein